MDDDAPTGLPRVPAARWRVLRRADAASVRALASEDAGASVLADLIASGVESKRAALDAHTGRIDRPVHWRDGLAHSLALESTDGALLAAALCVFRLDVLHECRAEVNVAFAEGLAGSPLAASVLQRMVAAAAGTLGSKPGAAAPDRALDVPHVVRVTLRGASPFTDTLAEAGFVRALVEDDLRLEPVAGARGPSGRLYLRAWDEASAPLFFRAYEAAFRERPGFPGWSEAVWREFASGHDTFRPDLSHVVLQDGEPAGFLTAAMEVDHEAKGGKDAGGQVAWVVQTGVVPSFRRRGLGRALLECLRARVEHEARALMLSVNENNPGARALFQAFGFEHHARRAVYRKVIYQPE